MVKFSYIIEGTTIKVGTKIDQGLEEGASQV